MYLTHTHTIAIRVIKKGENFANSEVLVTRLYSIQTRRRNIISAA
jgi:hypothetical protein